MCLFLCIYHVIFVSQLRSKVEAMTIEKESNYHRLQHLEAESRDLVCEEKN